MSTASKAAQRCHTASFFLSFVWEEEGSLCEKKKAKLYPKSTQNKDLDTCYGYHVGGYKQEATTYEIFSDQVLLQDLLPQEFTR